MHIILLIVLFLLAVIALGATAKPTTLTTGELIDAVNDAFETDRFHVYIGMGAMAVADIPDSPADVSALITGVGAKFVPYGNMDENIGKITAEPITKATDKGPKTIGWTLKGEFNSVRLSKAKSSFIFGEGTGIVSLLFVPMDEAVPTCYVLVSDIYINQTPALDLGGKDTGAKITFERRTNNPEAILYFDEVEAS